MRQTVRFVIGLVFVVYVAAGVPLGWFLVADYPMVLLPYWVLALCLGYWGHSLWDRVGP